MRCPTCDRSNETDSSFCIYCGESLQIEAPETRASVADDEMTLADLYQQVQVLRQDVSRIQGRLDRLGLPTAAQEPAARPAQGRPAPPYSRTGPEVPSGPPYQPPPSDVSQQGQSGGSFWDRWSIDWELVLGGNWLARIGVLAVVIGMGFFLKLAFDNNWIGEAGRVVLGILAGLGFIGIGEYLRKRYPVYAQALVGGGVGLLYLTIFAAYALFGLLPLYPGVGLLALVSVGSAVLAIRHDSLALAIIGILGAFVAPFVTGGVGGDAEPVGAIGPSFQLMAYVIVVDLGVLALSTFRSWRWFTILALLGSLLTFSAWYLEYGDDISLLTAQGSLTIIFLIFVAATTLFHLIWRRPAGPFDLTLMATNGIAYFGLSYELLSDDFRPWLGGFTLLLAVFYGAVAALALIRTRERIEISLMAAGIALVLLTIAVPVQLGGPWVSVGWAAEAVVLMWLSFRLRMWQLRAYSAGVFIVFTIWLLAVDTVDAIQADLTPLANLYLLPYLAGITAAFVGAFLVRKNRDETLDAESILFPALLVLGNVILTLAVPIQVDDAWIAGAWAAQAFALMWLSFKLGLVELRMISLGVFASLIARLLIFDTLVDPEEFRVLLNFRMLAFVSGVAALYGAAYLLHRLREDLRAWERREVFVAVVIAANFLTLWVLSWEISTAVDAGTFDVSDQTEEHLKSLGLSLLWAVYASVVLTLGIVGRLRYVRMAGLGLLAVPILKLFLVDSFALEQGYRVAAFMSLGGILLIGGFLYQRFAREIRGFLFEDGESASQT